MSLLSRFFSNSTKKEQTYNHPFSGQADDVEEDSLHISLQQLIKRRYDTRGLDFSHTLSRYKKSSALLSGKYRSPFKGRGLDFDEVRPYQPGDDIRSIDWNVTARTHRVHSKVFCEERERPIVIVVDFHASMYFATRGRLKSIQAAHLAALYAWIAADHHYHINGLVFTHQGLVPSASGRGQGGYKGVLKFLRLLQQQQVQLQKRFDQYGFTAPEQTITPQALFAQLRKVIKPGSLIVFISDFQFMTIDDMNLWHFLARHNDLIAHYIYDPLQARLPPSGQYALYSGYRKDKTQDAGTPSEWARTPLLIDTGIAALRSRYEQQFSTRLQQLEQTFYRLGGHFHALACHQDVTQVVKQFLGREFPQTTQIAKNRH